MYVYLLLCFAHLLLCGLHVLLAVSRESWAYGVAAGLWAIAAFANAMAFLSKRKAAFTDTSTPYEVRDES